MTAGHEMKGKIGIAFATQERDGGLSVYNELVDWLLRMEFTVLGCNPLPIVTGSVVFLAILFCLVMLVVDILYAFVDPRIRARYERQSARKGKIGKGDRPEKGRGHHNRGKERAAV